MSSPRAALVRQFLERAGSKQPSALHSRPRCRFQSGFEIGAFAADALTAHAGRIGPAGSVGDAADSIVPEDSSPLHSPGAAMPD